MKTIAIVDTTFARWDMADEAIAEILESRHAKSIRIVRATVPGMKDTPVAAKMLLDKGADIALILAQVGGEEIDETCAHEANIGIQFAQLLAGKHIISCFVHTRESPKNERKLKEIMIDRARKHALNCVHMLFEPELLRRSAGKGLRQGGKHAGRLQ